MPSVEEVLAWLSERAPLSLAEPWDNVGLQVGDPAMQVESLVIALEPTAAVVEFACAQNAQLLLTHHPLFLKPPARIVENEAIGKLVLQCARARLSVIAMHTNLDNAEGGVGDALASRLGLVNCRVLSPSHTDRLCKLVTFVPPDYADTVRNAMAAAGAGVIGEYTHCSFQVAGTGTFLPSAKAKPFIGKAGELEYAPELRLEMIVRQSRLPAVLDALLQSHPYEEVAHDVYPLEQIGSTWGCLKVGELDPPVAGKEFLQTVLRRLEGTSCRVIGALPERVKRVAVCGGSGAAFIEQVARSGVEVFVTGDVKHHDALAAHAAGLCVLDVGHAISERVAIEILAEWMKDFNNERARGALTCHLFPFTPPWEEVSFQTLRGRCGD